MEKENKIRVGILRGGEGEHHFISLRKGGDIISHIFENIFCDAWYGWFCRFS